MLVAGLSGEARTQGQHGAVPMLPPLLLHAFCDDEWIAATIRKAAAMPVLSQLTIRIRMGGIEAAERFYADKPTPALLVLQSQLGPESLLQALDDLAEVCDPETKVLILGCAADADLYRELLRRGVSGYLPLPVEMQGFSEALARIVPAEPAAGHTRNVAFLGVRGGVGSSALAQNIAYLAASQFNDRTLLVDMATAPGSAALNFDIEAAETHVVQRGALSVLTAAAPGHSAEHANAMAAFQQTGGLLFWDLPPIWTRTTQKQLLKADAIVVTATPDLGSLHNLAQLLDYLESLEQALPRPLLVLNRTGAAPRHEIPIEDFAEPGRLTPLASLPELPGLFSRAAQAGKMLTELDSTHPLVRTLERMTHIVTGRASR